MKSSSSKLLFEGESALRDYLDPSNHPPTPLVEIPAQLNPFSGEGVRFYAKLMTHTPLGNVKSLTALNMLLDAERRGKLEGVHTLVESSSGNTVTSLGLMAGAFGIQNVEAIVSHEVSPGKLAALRLAGVSPKIVREPICPDPSRDDGAIAQARLAGAREGYFNPGQYDNPANVGAHETWTGPQLFSQLGERLSVFVAGLGTTGTCIGTARYLRSHSAAVKCIGAVRSPNNPIPGVRTEGLLSEVSFPWRAEVDVLIEVDSYSSFAASLSLLRSGLFVGPSSGFVFAAACRIFEQYRAEGALDQFRNRDGEIVCAFICPDSPLPYMDEYFAVLGPEAFPAIRNSELLRERPQMEQPYHPPERTDEAFLLSPEHAAAESDRYLFIDLRSREEFEHSHIPRSIWMTEEELIEFTPLDRPLVLLCRLGIRTRILAALLQHRGYRAYSIRGGYTAWSALRLPRDRPEACRAIAGG